MRVARAGSRRATVKARVMVTAIAVAIAVSMSATLVGASREAGAIVMTQEAPSAIEQEYRAGKAASEEREARRHFQRGIELARRELDSQPDSPGALLWLAANLAAEALTHGRLFALRVVPEIESTLLRLERVHPAYDHAAAARALANLYWKAPALISVGSSRKATTYFRLALERAPDYPGNQAMAAAYLAERGDCPNARALAEAVRGRRDLDSFGPDAAEWRQLALHALAACD